jgi:hypothetical protein
MHFFEGPKSGFAEVIAARRSSAISHTPYRVSKKSIRTVAAQDFPAFRDSKNVHQSSSGTYRVVEKKGVPNRDASVVHAEVQESYDIVFFLFFLVIVILVIVILVVILVVEFVVELVVVQVV